MGNVLVFMEIENNKVKSGSLNGVTCARELAEKSGGEVYGLCVGGDIAEGAKDGANYVKKVFKGEKAGLETYMAETWAPVVKKAVEESGVDYLVATATNTAKDLFPRVTALLDCGMASEIVEVLEAKKFKRPTNAGNAIGTVEVLTDKVVLTARQTAYDPAEKLGDTGEVVDVEVPELNNLGAEVVEIKLSDSTRPDLGEAKVVISGGRGLKSKENFAKIEEFADLMGAAVGATRSAVDAGFVSNDLQVGQTGRVVAPDLYVAIGISGAIQHLAGMKGSKVIVAINKDEEAPIFEVADYGLVDTWEKSLEPLMTGIKKIQSG